LLFDYFKPSQRGKSEGARCPEAFILRMGAYLNRDTYYGNNICVEA